MTKTTLSVSLLAMLLTAGTIAVADGGGTFEDQVTPILRRSCVGCHNADKAKGKLDLSSIEKLLAGGKSGEVIVAGKSAESMLLDRITRRDRKVMPPRKAGKPLSESEVDVIRRWIDLSAATEIAAVGAGGGDELSSRQRKSTEAVVELDELVTNHSGPVASVAFSPDGSLLALGSEREVHVVEAESGTPVSVLEGHAEVVRSLSWSPDGTMLAAAGGLPSIGGEVMLWKTSDWTRLARIEGHRDAIYAAAFSPDGSELATASYDKLIKRWRATDSGTVEEIATLKDHIDSVFALAYSTDGRHIASAASDRTVKIWDSETSKRLVTLSDATKALQAVALSPTRNEVAAAGEDRTIRIWRFEGDRSTLLRSAFAHDGAVAALAYSPDGTRLFSAGEDGTAKVWDEAKLTEIRVFERQPDWILALSLSPDATRVAMGLYDGSWAVYDASTGEKVLGSTRAAEEAAQPDVEELAKASSGDGRPTEPTGVLVSAPDAGTVTVPPFLKSLSPRTVRPGAATVTLKGRDLSDAVVHVLGDGFTVRVVENKRLPRTDADRETRRSRSPDPTHPHEVELALDIAENAPPGEHEVVAVTPRGITNTLKIYLEEKEELAEHEPNDDLESANPVAWDKVMVGKMDRSGDEDCYRFTVREGDERVFHLVATTLGSKLNAILAITDGEGKKLARSDQPEFGGSAEARVAHRFAAGGEYFLRITDKNYGNGGFYRLHAGALPFVTSIFPPGLRRGTTAEVSLKGFGLGENDKVRLEAPQEVPTTAKVSVELPGAVRGAAIAVGEAPEVIETEPNDSTANAVPIESPGTANASIGAPGDEDFYRFTARRGETYIIDIVAERLGSLLDSAIQVLDADGQRLERATVRSVAQTHVVFRDVGSGSEQMRLRAWNFLQLRDLVRVGSEVLKVARLPEGPDEGIGFFAAAGRRVGLFDTTPQFHTINTPVYKVNVHPPGAELPPNGMPIFRLYFENDDGGRPVHGKDSRVHFTAPYDGEYFVRVRDVQSRGNDSFYYRLQIREPRPDFTFAVAMIDNLNVPSGARVPFRVTAERLDDFNGPIEIEVVDPPRGFEITPAPILPDQERATITVRANQGAQSQPLGSKVHLRARALIDGKEIVREATLGTLHVVGSPDLVVETPVRTIYLTAGEEVPVTAHIRRQNGFKARVRMSVPNLPHGIEVSNRGLNGILVPEGQHERTIFIHAAPWVPAQKRTIYLTGRTETSSPLETEYTTVPLTLVIQPEGSMARREF